jgi:RND family efflux transporter MFP subunit
MKVGDVKGMAKRSFPGRTRATQEVNLSFRVSGPLVTRPVNVGDKVKKGQILARIDPNDFQVRVRNYEGQLARSRAEFLAMRTGARPEQIRRLEAAVRAAEANFRQADLEYQRFAKALETNAVSKNVVDRKLEQRTAAQEDLKREREALQIGRKGARDEDIQAKRAEIKSLQAKLQSAKDNLSYTYLRAPFDGVISATFMDNFTDVRAKQAVVRLLDNSQVEFVVDIPESLIGLAHYVDKVRVRFDAIPGREFIARVKEIGAEASALTRTFAVTLIMDQPKDVVIRSGLAGRTLGATFKDGGELPKELQRDGFLVPVSAIFTEKGKQFVWVIDEKAMTVKKRPVTTEGALLAQGMHIKGVKAGEWIATAGVNRLREGQKVRIQKSKAS